MHPSRRFILKGLAAGGLNLLLPGGLYAQNGPRRKSPNEKLQLGVIGIGGRGTAAVGGLKHEDYLAFCDVDDAISAGSRKQYPNVPFYKDYREMFDRVGDKLDGVAVMTPDHSHFLIAMEAVKRGINVYVEKPLCQTIEQTRQLLDASKKAGVKTQMGNQGHSSDQIRNLKEWVDAGVLGQIMSIHAWTDRPAGWWPQGVKERPAAEPVPDTLAWDLWRHGIDVPYSSQYVPFKWRGWTAWGCGALGDMACHILDPMFFALDPGPPEWIQAESEGLTDISFPLKSTVTYHFPERAGRPAFDLVWRDGAGNPTPRPGVLENGRELGNPSGGSIIYGSRETAMSNSHAGSIRIIPDVRAKELEKDLPQKSLPRIAGQNHFVNWTDAIRGNVPEACSQFEYSARLNELVLLGVIAQRVPGVKLEWDPVAAKFRNSELATKLVSASIL